MVLSTCMELATTTVLFPDALSGKVLDMESEARRWSNGVMNSKICRV
jgi:hypothetical protein